MYDLANTLADSAGTVASLRAREYRSADKWKDAEVRAHLYVGDLKLEVQRLRWRRA